MPINVVWDNNNHQIVRWDITDQWDWTDVAVANRQCIEMINRLSEGKTASVIIHIQSNQPIRGDAFNQIRKAMLINPTRRDLIVVVGYSMYIRALVEIFRKMHSDLTNEICFAGSLDEAYKAIKQVQKSKV